MQVLIKAIVSFLYRRAETFSDGGLSSVFTWLMSNWVFMPFWFYVGTLEYTPSFTIGELLLGLPVITLVVFPLGMIQYGLYSLILNTCHRLLNKPRIISEC